MSNLPNPQDFVPIQVVVKGKSYTYKLARKWEEAVEAGDFVIVDFGTSGFQVGQVQSIGLVPLDPNAKFRYKWVASIVDQGDLQFYQSLLTAEATAIRSV